MRHLTAYVRMQYKRRLKPLNDYNLFAEQNDPTTLLCPRLIFDQHSKQAGERERENKEKEKEKMTAETVVNVLYGTVTGNAEEIARQLFELLPEKKVTQGLLRCLKDFKDVPAFMTPSEHSSNTYNVIVVSTTGDGDPPETIRPFMKLMRSKEKTRLSGLNYTVLALGDTNYENFCKTGKRIDASLTKLGATRFLKRGDADDGIGLELAVEPWLEKLYKELEIISSRSSPNDENSNNDNIKEEKQLKDEDNKKKEKELELESEKKKELEKEEEEEIIKNAIEKVTIEQLGFDTSKLPPVPTPTITVEHIDNEKHQGEKDVLSIHPSFSSSSSSNCYVSSVKDARLLTKQNADKSVWHMELICENPGSKESMSYRPGDAFGMIVKNDAEEVSRFLKVTKFEADQIVRLVDQNGETIITSNVERIVEERLDIRTIPSKTLLRVLSDYTREENERRQLIQLSSRAGRFEYSQRISKVNMTVLKLLEKLAPSCQAPIEVYIDLLPLIPLRWYSATSSPMLDGENVVHFAFSVVENGLATNALAKNCQAFVSGESNSATTTTDKVILIPRESDNDSHFHPPQSLHTDYIMIGPGTGVAPFRGFLRERHSQLKDVSSETEKVGKTMLFFGCRHEKEDFLYEDDLKQFVEQQVLSNLSLAFSRDTEQKIYVQDRLLEHEQQVAQVIRNDGCVFVCGDGGGMAMGVNKALVEIVTKLICDGDEKASNDYMKRLSEEHRYVRDIWYFG